MTSNVDFKSPAKIVICERFTKWFLLISYAALSLLMHSALCSSLSPLLFHFFLLFFNNSCQVPVGRILWKSFTPQLPPLTQAYPDCFKFTISKKNFISFIEHSLCQITLVLFFFKLYYVSFSSVSHIYTSCKPKPMFSSIRISFFICIRNLKALKHTAVRG